MEACLFFAWRSVKKGMRDRMRKLVLSIRSLWLKIKSASPGWFLAKLAIYAVFVVGYFFLVLHFLGDWVKQVFDENKTLYAIAALTLIIMQGVLLEILTSALMKVIRRKAR